MKRRFARLLLSVVVPAVAGGLVACGTDDPGTRVLGAQIARDDAQAVPADAETEGAASTAAPVASASPATIPPSAAPAPTSEPVAPEAPEPRPTTAGSPEAVSLEFRPDASTVAAGSDVRGTLVAHNPTDGIVDLTHPDQCETVQGVYQDGVMVSEGQACAMAVKVDQMAPGETRTWSIRIRTGALAPGAYEARVGVHLTPDRYAPPVAITITAA